MPKLEDREREQTHARGPILLTASAGVALLPVSLEIVWVTMPLP